MNYVYHGSKEKGLKILEPHKSTHGNYVYATKYKVLALHFSGRCGDDLTYDIGHFDNDKNGPWELVENIPGAFDKMYSNSSSIYTISDETFKDIHTGFEEVVSESSVNIIKEEVYENVWQGLLISEQEGLLKIYRYPNKPLCMKKDGSDILDKWRFYKTRMNKEFTKNEFDRLVYLHPNLLNGINDLSQEFGYDYHYEPNDLIDNFDDRIKRQLQDPEHEQYVDCAYVSMCETYPSIKEKIDTLYNNYINKL